MTNPCNCKAEHWQPHADSCPQAKQLAPKIGVNSEDIVDLLRKVPRATALPPDEEGWRLMIGGICHKAADELTQLRGNLSLAEEGLANYALEVEGLRSDFKNFHRLLCERFGYGHDEYDWLRDQLSLIEWIAKRVAHEPLACDCPEGAETTDPSKHEEYCDYRQANAEKSNPPQIGAGIPPDGAPSMPFDCAAILGAPRERRISMSFQTQEQYEAALVFLDMADTPSKSPAHTTEEDFQHFMAYSNLKESHALRWAFYAGKGEPPPGKAGEGTSS